MTHGVNTKPSTFASQLVSPHPRTRFQQAIADKKEQLYLSHRKAPLGVSHDQSPGFPGGLDPVYFTFGIKTERGTSLVDVCLKSFIPVVAKSRLSVLVKISS